MRELVERVVGAIGIAARVEVHETDEEMLVTCTGGDLGLLIGKHGQTIDALQYLANAAVYRSGARQVGDGRRGRLPRPPPPDARGDRRSQLPSVQLTASGCCSSR